MPPRIATWISLSVLLASVGCSSEAQSPGDAAAELPDSASLELPDAAPDGSTPATTLIDGCNPLAPELDCLLPFPSDVFLVDDATMPSGKRVAVSLQALPHSRDGDAIDLFEHFPLDGFALLPQIHLLLPGGVSQANLVRHFEDPLESLLPATTTSLILEAATGEPVLHFAEVDQKPAGSQPRVLVLRPMVRLKERTRYLVALQGLETPDGAPLAPPTNFRRLRDGEAADDPQLGELADRYEAAVFPVLEAAGVTRAGLQLAWEFTTGSEERLQRDMLAVRADAIQRYEQQTPPVSVVEVIEDPADEFIGRRIEATVRVPHYMAAEGPQQPLNRDADGNVQVNGEVDAPFSLIIPRSVLGRDPTTPPAPLIQFGHGFFGGRLEAQDHPAKLGHAHGFVIMTGDWWGMSGADIVPLLEDLAWRSNQAPRFIDRVYQAMVNVIGMTYAARGPLAELPQAQVGDPAQPAYDVTTVKSFYGISEGHILGGTYTTLSPHIERVILNAGGCGFGLIMSRSRAFYGYELALEQMLPAGDTLMLRKVELMLGHAIERIDPIVYAPRMRTNTLEGSPPERQVLLQLAIGDFSVPTLAGNVHARALGLPLLQPAPREVLGLESVTAPHEGSALAEFDFQLDPPIDLEFRIPPEVETDAHEELRRLTTTMAQVNHFLRTGVIDTFCDGICDPD